MTRIVFLGTPEPAVPTLRLLAAQFDVGLVVTQPDKSRGRSGAPTPSPVKAEAARLGITVGQPRKATEIAPVITSAGGFDLGVVVAYGRILRPDVLSLPGKGLLNVHFSLLPRWRGAAPVARALMEGDPMSGVTIIKIDEGMDTGPVLTAQAVDIGVDETAGELTARLATLGARLIAASIPGYMAGDLVPVTQTDEGVEYAHKIEASDRRLDVDFVPRRFVDHVRALAPNPGATLNLDGQTFKILEAREAEQGPLRRTWEEFAGRPVVGLADGAVELVVVQPPGRRAMAGADWLRGARKIGGVAG